MWPFVESAHVLTLGLFVGTTAMMDLRLLGIAFRKVPITAFTGRLLPWTRIGFTIMTTTGLLLFYSQPLRYYHNIFFRESLCYWPQSTWRSSAQGRSRSAYECPRHEAPAGRARRRRGSLTAWACRGPAALA